LPFSFLFYKVIYYFFLNNIECFVIIKKIHSKKLNKKKKKTCIFMNYFKIPGIPGIPMEFKLNCPNYCNMNPLVESRESLSDRIMEFLELP